MQKYLKNNKGFTLVEVIVVAVIVLILAAVAIPLYNGYIKDARLSVAENTAGSIASAMGASNQAFFPSTMTGNVSNGNITQAGVFTVRATPANATEAVTVIIPKGYNATIGPSYVSVGYGTATDIVASVQYRQ